MLPIFSVKRDWFSLPAVKIGFCNNDWWTPSNLSLLQPLELAPDLVDFVILTGFWDSEEREVFDDWLVEVVWWGAEVWFVLGVAVGFSVGTPGE